MELSVRHKRFLVYQHKCMQAKICASNIPLLDLKQSSFFQISKKKFPCTSANIQERSLFLRICITWLAMTVAKGSVQSFDISALNPGVHIHNMGDTFIKTFELTFTAMTPINVTADINQIKIYVPEFSSTCE